MVGTLDSISSQERTTALCILFTSAVIEQKRTGGLGVGLHPYLYLPWYSASLYYSSTDQLYTIICYELLQLRIT